MLQAFIIVLREGFESFLIAAIILAYLKKTGHEKLALAVYLGSAFSVIASIAFGYVLLRGVNEPLWEGVLGLVAIVMVASLVIHMWKTAPHLKKDMEKKLQSIYSEHSQQTAFWGVFLFTAFMITREGMETALFIIQIRDTNYLAGMFLGGTAAIGVSLMWVKFSRLINVRRFFQVTGVFLLLFLVQIAIYSFHEFCEAGIFPNSDAWHAATEPYSPDGMYGKWFSLILVATSALWLAGAWLMDKFSHKKKPEHGTTYPAEKLN